jgi:hypothetical protein
MFRIRLALTAFFLIAVPASAALRGAPMVEPPVVEPPPPDVIRAAATSNETSMRNYPAAPANITLAEVPRLVEENGELVIKPPEVNLGTLSRIDLGSSPLMVAFRHNATQSAVYYFNPDGVDGDGFYFIRWTKTAATLQITAYGGFKSGVYVTNLTRSNTSLNLSVQEVGPANQVTARSLYSGKPPADLNTIRKEKPAEFERFVQPILELTSLVGLLRNGPADAYRVFTELKPAKPIEDELIKVVLLLGSPDARKRQEAQKQLDRLGRPGLLAALRFDRSLLVPEESASLDAFIARNSLHRTEDPAVLRKDRHFLLECLTDEDREVRRVALAELRAVLRQDLAFDIDAAADQRQAAVEVLRKHLGR